MQKGSTHTTESKLRISESRKGKPSGMLGKKMRPYSIEHRLKIGNALRGKKKAPLSEENRRKRSEILRGKPSRMKGKRHSEATKQKMSLSHVGKQHSESAKQKMSEWKILHPNKKYSNTSIEKKLQKVLDSLGVLYLAQHPIEKIAIVDFYIPEKRIILECDGCYYHNCLIHYPTFHVKRRKHDIKKNKTADRKRI